MCRLSNSRHVEKMKAVSVLDIAKMGKILSLRLSYTFASLYAIVQRKCSF